jgi:hypothetical protein
LSAELARLGSFPGDPECLFAVFLESSIAA